MPFSAVFNKGCKVFGKCMGHALQSKYENVTQRVNLIFVHSFMTSIHLTVTQKKQQLICRLKTCPRFLSYLLMPSGVVL